MRRSSLCSLMAAGLFAGLAACGDEISYPVLPTEEFVATLAGANEVPPVTSAASGTVILGVMYDTVLTWRIDVAAIDSPTVVRIFSGAAGVAGGDTLAVLFAGPGTCNATNTTSPSCRAQYTGTINPGLSKASQLTIIPVSYGATPAARFTALLGMMRAGTAYIQVHNRANPTGHMRGQIAPL